MNVSRNRLAKSILKGGMFGRIGYIRSYCAGRNAFKKNFLM